MSGLKVREEFQEPNDSNDEIEYKSDISDEEEDCEADNASLDPQEVTAVDADEEGSSDGSSDPEFEDLV